MPRGQEVDGPQMDVETAGRSGEASDRGLEGQNGPVQTTGMGSESQHTAAGGAEG